MIKQLPEYCGNGHKYTPANIYWRSGKHPGSNKLRVCRACNNAAGRRYNSTTRDVVAYKRKKNPNYVPLPVGHPIPQGEIHVTHTGIYFGRTKPDFKYAFIWFDIEPTELVFEPSNTPVRGIAWSVNVKQYDYDGQYSGYVMQPFPILNSGKIPFGVYEQSKDDPLTYYLSERPLPKWCRDGVDTNASKRVNIKK